MTTKWTLSCVGFFMQSMCETLSTHLTMLSLLCVCVDVKISLKLFLHLWHGLFPVFFLCKVCVKHFQHTWQWHCFSSVWVFLTFRLFLKLFSQTSQQNGLFPELDLTCNVCGKRFPLTSQSYHFSSVCMCFDARIVS